MSFDGWSRAAAAKGRVLSLCVVGLFAMGNTGCSLLFVTPPRSHAGVSASRDKCTSSKAPPVLDTIITGLQLARTVYAAAAPDSVYRDPKQPLSRGADIGLGLGFSALFLGSAIYGYGATSRCAEREPKRLRDEDEMDEEHDDAPAGYPGTRGSTR
jgi:hypothetical protein